MQQGLQEPLPLCHLLLLLPLIVFFLLVAPSPCLSQTYSSDCAPIPYSCGDINFTLTYPFRLQSQPDYCGHPAFSLNCTNNNSTLILPIGGNIYKVKSIDTLNRLLTIVNTDFVDQSCPTAYQNTTLDSSLYDYDEYNRNLTMFFNCTASSSIPAFNEVGCLLGVTGKHSYYRLDNGSFSDVLGRCSSTAVTPMTLEAANLFQNGNLSLGAALQEGFGVRWTVGSDWCGSCVSSGGLCGFNRSAPLAHTCLCANASYIDTCNPGNTSEKKKTVIIIAGSVSAACGFLLACVLCYLLYRHKKRRQNPPPTPVFRTASSEPSSMKDTKVFSIIHPTHVFSYSELQEATNCFDVMQELGDGGFATVYKGKLLDGRTVAVKRLYDSNYKRVEQFINEVAILSRLRHPNLVTLYGCTSHDSRELLLVYELVPNGTVADHLHGLRKGTLTWPLRMGIAIETAEALAYLHAVKPPIIHRDVKTNNILLDNSFHVKVADFGLSRNFPADATHVSTVPQGTPGYLDPQYHQFYQLTDKSDVYSFGVVLVELISSKMAVDINRHQDEINLASMALNKIRNQKLEQLVDPGLGYQSNCEMKRMINSVAEVAFRCLQMDRDMRPTIKEVLETLKTIEEGNGCKVEDGRTSVSLPFSTDSVIDKWGSGYTTPSNNESGSF